MTDTNQASEGGQRTLDDILSQAFTDGASDTMWIADRHIEIFATAKEELLNIIRTEKLKLLDRLLEHGEDFTTFGDGNRSVAVEYIKAERKRLGGQ